MNVVLKVQRVRACVQCGDVLSKKCDKCKKHPTRQPRIIELYDFPAPLKVAECGCCILLRCQRPGCHVTFWRSTKNNAVKGKSRHATFVCSGRCRSITANAGRKTSILLPCGWCEKPVSRQPAQIPLKRIVFCKPVCWYLYRTREAARRNAIKREPSLLDPAAADLQCEGKCRAITEHVEIAPNRYRCRTCSHVRSDVIKVPTGSRA